MLYLSSGYSSSYQRHGSDSVRDVSQTLAHSSIYLPLEGNTEEIDSIMVGLKAEAIPETKTGYNIKW